MTFQLAEYFELLLNKVVVGNHKVSASNAQTDWLRLIAPNGGGLASASGSNDPVSRKPGTSWAGVIR
jgi:hypothetical protein